MFQAEPDGSSERVNDTRAADEMMIRGGGRISFYLWRHNASVVGLKRITEGIRGQIKMNRDRGLAQQRSLSNGPILLVMTSHFHL